MIYFLLEAIGTRLAGDEIESISCTFFKEVTQLVTIDRL